MAAFILDPIQTFMLHRKPYDFWKKIILYDAATVIKAGHAYTTIWDNA
jgi:hypothetical protein